jgi:hypothetical protein
LREATATDAPAIAALHVASWRSAYRGALPDAYLDGPIEPERLATWTTRLGALAPGDVVLLAERGGSLDGFAAAFARDDGDALLDNLHIAPARHGQGLGAALLAETAVRLAARGSRTMHLWVFDVNAAAQRFYMRLGAIETGRRVETMFGAAVPETRFGWPDLDALLSRPA